MPEESALRNKGTVETWGRQGYQMMTPKYRKRRKSEGIEDQVDAMTTHADELEAAKRHNRVYCKGCGCFRVWKDLRAGYEQRGTDWWMMWFCKKCGDMVKERNLDDRL